jgi:hypothetical protein
MPLAAGIYWHPLNLPHYITRRDLTGVAQALVRVPVLSASAVTSPYVISAVYAPTHAEMIAGDWEYLADGVSFTSTGYHDSGWRDIAPLGQANVFIGMVLEVPSSVSNLSLGPTELRIGGGGEVGGITFPREAPGMLTLESGEYFADWKVADTHFGYTKPQAQALIASFLDSPYGWQQVGITFRYSETANVTFEVVEEASGDVPELAYAFYDQTPPHTTSVGKNYVELEYGPLNGSAGVGIGAGNIINHEAGHAFFFAQHAGVGIMADFDNNRPVWPSDSDILSVREWLGI